MSRSVERFSSRVENYARFRPGYPFEILDLLKSECGLKTDSVVADVGSGTGILSEIFLKNGNVVLGVEPNAGMRKAAEALLHHHSKFKSIDGSAETTTLPNSSVDFALAGQAFHWFDPAATRIEWQRIMKPGGWAVLIWNERKLDTTPFLRDYEMLLVKYSIDYPVVRHENAIEAINIFFSPQAPSFASFPNTQEFDFVSLRGRLESTSYTPEPGDPRFEPMIEELKKVYEDHNQSGLVWFEYATKIYYGQLGS